MAYWVYVQRSERTNRRYTGSCQELEDRLRRHNQGESKATKNGVPWNLVHSETFATRAEAARRERYSKTGKGRAELDRILFPPTIRDPSSPLG